MELKKESIKTSMEKGKAFSQITLEDDSIIPDSKPDVLKVVHTQGTIWFDESKISNQALWINGRMNFTVLYRSENEEKKLESVTGSIPFQEKLVIDGIEEIDKIRIRGCFEDLGGSIINSRKLAIRSVVDIIAVAENETEEEIATGVMDGEHVEEKIGQEKLLQLMYNQKDVLRIRKEIELPSAKPNIGEVLHWCISLKNVQTEPEQNKILLRGDAGICVIYQSEGEEGLQCFENVIPFEGTLDSTEFDPEEIYWICTQNVSTELEAREDYDGEPRVFGMELSFDVTVKIWKEIQIPVLLDVYSLTQNLQPQKEYSTCEKLLIHNQAKVRLAEQFQLEKDQEKMMQICCSFGELMTERMTLEEQGLYVEGVLKVHILYMTSDEFLPIAHEEAYIAVEQLVEIPPAENHIHYELQSGIEQLNVNLMSSDSYEIKAQIFLDLIAFETVSFEKITNLITLPFKKEEQNRQSGIVGYIAREGEEIWDIAKKYHTTVKRIMEMNDLQEDALSEGQKLLIVKEVYS